MPEVPDLSKLKNGSAPTDPEPPAQPVLRTAFLVLVGADGNVVVSTDVDHEVEHTCTPDDIYVNCAFIMKDIQIQQTAGLVQQALLQMGSMMQQAQVDQQIRKNIKLK